MRPPPRELGNRQENGGTQHVGDEGIGPAGRRGEQIARRNFVAERECDAGNHAGRCGKARRRDIVMQLGKFPPQRGMVSPLIAVPARTPGRLQSPSRGLAPQLRGDERRVGAIPHDKSALDGVR